MHNVFIQNLQNLLILYPLKNMILLPWLRLGLMQILENLNSKSLVIHVFVKTGSWIFIQREPLVNEARGGVLIMVKDELNPDSFDNGNDSAEMVWCKVQPKELDPIIFCCVYKPGKSTTIQDKSGKCLTEENEILNRWKEYCSDLYNYETDGDPIVLDCPQIPDEEHHPILRAEVEAAVKALKMGKSAGVDNIPAELVQAGGEAMINILNAICNKIWKTGEWPTTWTQSLVITLPKKGNLQLCQNYRTISLISHPSKVMLKVILNRLQPQAEEIIAEEQAGFRAGRSTTEQIFNLRILCEKYLQHQQNLYHVFIDFKKAFGRVWHEALWATMRKYKINASIKRAIENLYDKAQSAVLFNGSTEWFRTTVGVRQGCLLSPTLFNIFLERIMCEALDDHEVSVSIGGRLITNFRFADDIVVNAEEEEEAGVLIDRLDRTTTRYKMEIGPDKTKVMTNNPNGFQREIKIKGQRLEEVENFKYLGAIISNEGSKPEILSRIVQTTAALSRLKIIWRDNNSSLASKVKLMRTLILSTFFYACESWTLTAEIERRIQALEMRCYRRLLNISYKDHVTNEEVRNRIQNAIGVHDDLLTMVKKRKLRWYGHISRSSGMAKTILQGTVKGARRRGRQKKRWEDNIKEWTGMGFWRFPEGSGRQGRMERHCCNVICGAPTTSKFKGLRWEMI